MGTTLTPKLGLILPDNNEIVDVINHIDYDLTRIDTFIGVYICTSGTRPTPFNGLEIYETDTKKKYIYQSGAWTLVADLNEVRPYRFAAGTATVNFTNDVVVFTNVTLPASRFTVAPIITCSLSSAPGGSAKINSRALHITTTDFDAYFYTGDGLAVTATSVQCMWTAVQMTSSAAAG